jgi:hypothetical protein
MEIHSSTEEENSLEGRNCAHRNRKHGYDIINLKNQQFNKTLLLPY